MKNLSLIALFALIAAPAQAYVGPGAGAGAILAAVAVLAGVVLLIAGFLYFPIKRALKARKAAAQD
ncbi:MAG: hypothetical protein AAFQ54_05620 [Pseudomonadota bacterium]